jgi:hypothetical protein
MVNSKQPHAEKKAQESKQSKGFPQSSRIVMNANGLTLIGTVGRRIGNSVAIVKLVDQNGLLRG